MRKCKTKFFFNRLLWIINLKPVFPLYFIKLYKNTGKTSELIWKHCSCKYNPPDQMQFKALQQYGLYSAHKMNCNSNLLKTLVIGYL